MNRWIRELTSSSTGSLTGIPFALKSTALFLRYGVGFTPVASVGSDWYSTEKSGTNGEINLTGTDKRFRDSTAASFVSGDTGKWLLVVGNDRNTGWYKVTYVDASNVDLDFRSGVAEYPTSQTGLSWYLLADNYQVPSSVNDYFTTRTPHALGWEIELKLLQTSGDNRVSVRVAPSGDWGSVIGPVYTGSYGSRTNWLYCAVDSAGEWLNFMLHQSTDNRYNGFCVTTVSMLDTGHANIEKVVLCGNTSSDAVECDNSNWVRLYTDKRISHGYSWVSGLNAQVAGYMMEYSSTISDDGFGKWASREQNSRISKSDVLTGSYYVLDETNMSRVYSILGILNGHYKSRGGTAGGWGTRKAFNDSGTLDKIHWTDGFAFDWPNITPQH